MSPVDELRQLTTRMRLLQDESAKIRALINDHPAKPAPSEQTIESVAAWTTAKAPLVSRRQEIVAELKELGAQRDAIRKTLNQTPVSRETLASVLDRLLDVEAIFAVKGKEESWDQLSSLIDYFEYEEARLSVESQVAKLESV